MKDKDMTADERIDWLECKLEQLIKEADEKGVSDQEKIEALTNAIATFLL